MCLHSLSFCEDKDSEINGNLVVLPFAAPLREIGSSLRHTVLSALITPPDTGQLAHRSTGDRLA